MKKRCHCHGRCGCEKKIVHPTREEVKNVYTEETINHVYPTHTTVVNNHLIRNVYSYPHSTSHETRVREIDERNRCVGGVEDNGGCSNSRGVRGTQTEGGKCGSCSTSRCSCRRGGFWF